jgi:cytochrome c biogenesis protein ResB
MPRLHRFRRLKVRYDRQDDVHQAFLEFRCALIRWRCVQRCCTRHTQWLQTAQQLLSRVKQVGASGSIRRRHSGQLDE